MKKVIKLDSYHQISDMALAATIALFYPIESVNRTNPAKALFLFKQNEQLNELIQAYWNDSLKVNPKSYYSKLREIKNRIHNEL